MSNIPDVARASRCAVSPFLATFLLRKWPFERTADYAIARKIPSLCSREVATGALAPGEAKRNPGYPSQCHYKPRTGRGNNRAMRPRPR